MRVTAVLNQKGGVGKTALSVGLAAALAELGRRVLLVDLDPQGHATTEALGLAEAEGEARLARALPALWHGPAKELATRHSDWPDGGLLDVWATSVDMFLVEHELALLRVQREGQLARLLGQVSGDYDDVVIDCPPALNGLTDNALTAADGLLIPVTLDPSMLRALRLLLDQTESLDRQLGRAPVPVHGLVPGLFRRPLSKLAESVRSDLERIGAPMLGPLPLSVTVPEAWRAGVPIIRHSPEHEHTRALRAIAATLTGQHVTEPQQ